MKVLQYHKAQCHSDQGSALKEGLKIQTRGIPRQNFPQSLLVVAMPRGIGSGSAAHPSAKRQAPSRPWQLGTPWPRRMQARFYARLSVPMMASATRAKTWQEQRLGVGP